jgi:NADH:ubiquinone oxidoreductase subunit 4 (subunit M)
MVNRVGDWAFLIGLFLLFWVYGNLDFSSIFSLTPLINDRVLTLIGACLLVGAMAKSAQLGLHVWLPNAMEGQISFRTDIGLVLWLSFFDIPFSQPPLLPVYLEVPLKVTLLNLDP